MHRRNIVNNLVPALNACDHASVHIYEILRIQIAQLLPHPFGIDAVTLTFAVAAELTHLATLPFPAARVSENINKHYAGRERMRVEPHSVQIPFAA